MSIIDSSLLSLKSTEDGLFLGLCYWSCDHNFIQARCYSKRSHENSRSCVDVRFKLCAILNIDVVIDTVEDIA